MIPHRIRLENFLTFAGPVEFDFTGGEPLWVIGGPNGVGKSAVFDAVTLALFGVHRGGKQRFDELVRHGADSFRVTLEFEFSGTEYRITRSFSGGKQVAPKLESRQPGGTWAADRRVTKVNDLTPLVEQLLGLSYDTFTKSVLLKQGEADRLFSASREERAAILKGVIGFEQYEALSERVHEAATESKGSHEQLRRQFESLSPVGDEELAAAESKAGEAGEVLRLAREAKEEAVKRVERAKQWGRLHGQEQTLRRQLADADDRTRDAEAIIAGKRRFGELEAVVPHCETLLSVRSDLATATTSRERLEADLGDATRARECRAGEADAKRMAAATHKDAADAAEREGKDLLPLIAERRKWLGLATELRKLAGELSRYPKDLADQLTRANAEENAASEELKRAEKEFTQADTLLGVAVGEEEAFADVEVGATCPHCRQRVSEEHAAEFLGRLRERLQNLKTTKAKCEEVRQAATTRHAAAQSASGMLESRTAERARLDTTFTTKREHLEREGGSADVDAHAEAIEAYEARARSLKETAAAERRLQTEAEGRAAALAEEVKCLDSAIEDANTGLVTVGQQVAKLGGRRDEVFARIPVAWQEFASCATTDRLSPLKAELASLRDSKVAARHEELAKDAAQRAGWEKQLADTLADIGAIPEPDRVPEGVAEAARLDAAARVTEAEEAATLAGAALRDLRGRAESYVTTTRKLCEAERRAGLLKRLDDLLGEKGLERELVRAAEHEVVSLADDTLRQLTHQELSIEPDPDATGRADKAFALRVRKAGDPNPIGIDFISGSQRFRVAVSLALALGRFAAGKQRPIEAVIIDEGFGSLDEDGLRAMADNLNELRRTQSLKRILLVSHQKNFTDQFAYGYRLSPGEAGTTAVRLA